MTKLHAGSLYKNYLVLYGENEIPRCIQVNEEKLQWEIYCNDVEFTVSSSVDGFADVTFVGEIHHFPYWETNEPMKFLGFGNNV